MKCKHAMLKLSAVLMALSFTAQADVFRCEIGGRTTYTDQPSKGCASVAIRDEPADPEALLRARRNREAYEQSMAQWREHYLRDIELRAAARQARSQRPVVTYTSAPEPVYPAYWNFPLYPAVPFAPGFKHPGFRKQTPVESGPARIGMDTTILRRP
ncbi:hypothetical protein [Methylocaldum szegediense]|uniref:DUF4124 domain-containing protein n=1 Tax=Methylocaldum szegediense TaxID=73780 RepID=A0ABM9HZR2_9GAMM|nr:hypothetical protein [Methylocaldum szegediense]CAI8795074.1 exported protein of unknown function [Methylocaldum szegediense]